MVHLCFVCFLPDNNIDCGANVRQSKKKKKNFPHFHPLVRFLPVCSTWSWPTVIGLDDECVFLLQLTVNGTPCSKPTFSRCLVQHNGFEGHFLPMDFKSTNFTCEEQHKTIITGVGGEGGESKSYALEWHLWSSFVFHLLFQKEKMQTRAPGHCVSKRAINQVPAQWDVLSAAPGTLLPLPPSVLNGFWKPKRPFCMVPTATVS